MVQLLLSKQKAAALNRGDLFSRRILLDKFPVGQQSIQDVLYHVPLERPVDVHELLLGRLEPHQSEHLQNLPDLDQVVTRRLQDRRVENAVLLGVNDGRADEEGED